jgi:predicted nucleotidyltransferase
MVYHNLEISDDVLADFCRRWGVTELALFGSVLRDDFRPESDVDVLVTFGPAAHPGLFDLVDMQDELARILGRKVDLVSRRGVEQSRNHLRRTAILSSAETIYVQR